MVPGEKLKEKSKYKEQIIEKEERMIPKERKLLGDKMKYKDKNNEID